MRRLACALRLNATQQPQSSLTESQLPDNVTLKSIPAELAQARTSHKLSSRPLKKMSMVVLKVLSDIDILALEPTSSETLYT